MVGFGILGPHPERKSRFPSWVAGLKRDAGVNGSPGRVTTFFRAADFPGVAEAGSARLAAPTVAVTAMEPFRKERRGDFGVRIVDLLWKRLCAQRGLETVSALAPGRVRSYHNLARSQKCDVMGGGGGGM